MPVYALDDLAPTLPRGFYWIAETATVLGNVTLGEEVGIWFGAALRGDIEPITIGARTNIQENCVLHTDTGCPLVIGAGCTIGHSAVVHGCTIGENSLIGMGAVILNGAQIGANCIIGAGSLISERKVIPPNSLVMGSPGKLVREVDAAGMARLEASAAAYVARARQCAAGLRRIGPVS